jgi:hypothetical protein
MLTQEFCEFLEFEITRALEASQDERLKGFWCDGVLLPSNEAYYSKKVINDQRQITTLAFAGKSGQDEYELTLRFGPKALSRYARDLSLQECVPDGDSNDWVRVDVDKKTMVVHLD